MLCVLWLRAFVASHISAHMLQIPHPSAGVAECIGHGHNHDGVGCAHQVSCLHRSLCDAAHGPSGGRGGHSAGRFRRRDMHDTQVELCGVTYLVCGLLGVVFIFCAPGWCGTMVAANALMMLFC